MKILNLIFPLFVIISCGSPNSDNKAEENQKPNLSEQTIEEFTLEAIGNTMQDMKYSLENISVSSGNKVIINLINKGSDPAMIHNILIINFGSRKEVAMESIEAGQNLEFIPNNKNVIAASKLAYPGDSVKLEFNAPEPGNYEFICTYPGHAEMMRGYFFVN